MSIATSSSVFLPHPSTSPRRLGRLVSRVAGAALGLPLALVAARQAQATTLTNMAKNQDVTAGALFNMVANYAMVGGVGIAMLGLIQMAFAHKKQESMKPGAVMLIIGGVLASIIAVLHSGSASIFGSDQTMTGNTSGMPTSP